MSSRRFLALLLLLLCCSRPGTAAQALVGTIDMRLLVVLHPRMVQFDFTQGRFFRTQPTDRKGKSMAKSLEGAWAGIEQQLGRLTAEVKRLRRIEGDLVKRREETLNSLQENAKARASRDYPEKFKEFQERYQRLLTDNARKLAEAEAAVQEIQEKAYAPLYLSEQETATQLQQIHREIQQTMEAVVQDMGLKLVLDPSLNQFHLKDQSFREVPSAPPPPFDLGPRFMKSLQTYDAPYQQERVPGPSGELINAASHVALARGQSLLRTARKYLNLSSYLTLARQDLPLPPTPLLVGGTDITATVGQRILQANQIPQAQQTQILKLLSSYLVAEFQNQVW